MTFAVTDGWLKIEKAPVTVKAAVNPAEVVKGNTPKYSYTFVPALLGGDTAESAFGGEPTFTWNGSEYKPAESVPDTYKFAYKYGDTSASNYEVTYEEATFTVVGAVVYNETKELYYSSLATAVEEASANDVLRIEDNVALTAAVAVDKALTINLNGKTVSSTDTYAFTTAADVTIYNGEITSAKRGVLATDGTLNLGKGGDESSTLKITTAERALAVYDHATVNVNKDATLASTGYYAVVPWGNVNVSDGNATLNVYGTVKTTSSDAGHAAISMNGTDSGTVNVNVFDGASVSSENGVGIYQPSGNVTVSGGTVTGKTAIYQKSGSLTVSGGTLESTGTAAAYAYTADGYVITGDALVVDNCGYPGAAPVVSITGGTFRSTNAKAVGSYAKDSTFTVLTGFISPTGTALFSDDVSDGVPAGYELVPAGEGYDGLYKLAPLTGILYVTGKDANGKNRGVMMDVAWLKANGFIAGEVATQAELDGMQVALSAKSTNGNGLPYWQSYVLGVDPNGTYPLTIAKGVSSGANYIITGKFAGSTGFNLTPSKNATMTVEFTLVQRGAFDADAKDWTWTKVNGVTSNVSNTAAPQFTVSMDAVANQVLAISVTIMVNDK